MIESRLMGDIKDFIFIESQKVKLPFKKSEKGTHTKLVTVHGKTKTFKRLMRVGIKETTKPKIEKLSEKESLEWKEWQKYYKEKLFRPSVSPHEDYASQAILIGTSPQHVKSLIRKYQAKDPGSMGIDLAADFELLYQQTKDDVPKKHSLHIDNLTEIKSLTESGIPSLIAGLHEEDTYICKFKNKSQAIHKTILPSQIVGEVGTYGISKILNWDIVPETVQFNYGHGEGSTQKWIPNGKEPMDNFNEGFGIELKEKHFDRLSKIFILDMITSNSDRHSGNLIIDENDKIWAIDNEDWGEKDKAKICMESLEGWAEKGSGRYVPMITVLVNSIGNDVELWKKFKSNVDDNLIRVRKHQNKIEKYLDQYINDFYKELNDKYGTTETIIDSFANIKTKEAIKNVKNNINYLNKYYIGQTE